MRDRAPRRRVLNEMLSSAAPHLVAMLQLNPAPLSWTN
jgi:hypothetical protein